MITEDDVLDPDKPYGNRWFGEPFPSAAIRAGYCDFDELRIPTPVGSRCMSCDRVLTEDDQGQEMPYYDGQGAKLVYVHRVCSLRAVMGCSASLRGEGHDHSGDYYEDALKVDEWVDRNRSRC